MDERPDESWPRLRGTDPFRPHPLRDPGRDLPVAGSRGRGVNNRAVRVLFWRWIDRVLKGASECTCSFFSSSCTMP